MNVQPDIVFGRVGDRELRLDIFTPDPEKSLRNLLLGTSYVVCIARGGAAYSSR